MAGQIQGNIAGMQPEAGAALSAALKVLDAQGVPYGISPRGAFRSYADQAALYADRGNNRYPVAKPGSSAHERGTAVDVTFPAAVRDLGAGILADHGFTRPLPDTDPVHFTFGSGKAPAPAAGDASPFSSILSGAPTTQDDAGAPFSSILADTPIGLSRLKESGGTTLPPPGGMSLSQILSLKGDADLSKVLGSSLPPLPTAAPGPDLKADLQPGIDRLNAEIDAASAPPPPPAAPFSSILRQGPVVSPQAAVDYTIRTGGLEPPATGPLPPIRDYAPTVTTTQVLGHALQHPTELPGALWHALGQLWGAGSALTQEFAHDVRTQGPLAFFPSSPSDLVESGAGPTPHAAQVGGNLAGLLQAAVSAFQDYGHPDAPGAITEALGIGPGSPGWARTGAKIADYAGDLLGNPAGLAMIPLGEGLGQAAGGVGRALRDLPLAGLAPEISNAGIATALRRTPGEALWAITSPEYRAAASEGFGPAQTVGSTLGGIARGIGDAVAASPVGQFAQGLAPNLTGIGREVQRALSGFRANVETDAFHLGNSVQDMAAWTADAVKSDPAFADAAQRFAAKPPVGAAGPGPLQDLVLKTVMYGSEPQGAQQIARLAGKYGVPLEAVTTRAQALGERLRDLFVNTGQGTLGEWQDPEVRAQFLTDDVLPTLFVKVPGEKLGQLGSQAFAANGVPAILNPHWQGFLKELDTIRQEALVERGIAAPDPFAPAPQAPAHWPTLPNSPVYHGLAGLAVPQEVYRAATGTAPMVEGLLGAARKIAAQGPAAVAQGSDFQISQVMGLIKKVASGFPGAGLERTAIGAAQRVGQAGLGVAVEGGNPARFVQNVAAATREIAAAYRTKGAEVSDGLEEFMRNAPGFWQTEFKTLALSRGKNMGEVAGIAPAPQELANLGGKFTEAIPNARTRQDQILQYALYKTLLPVVEERLAQHYTALAPGLTRAVIGAAGNVPQPAKEAARVTAQLVGHYLFDFSQRKFEPADRLGLDEIGDALKALRIAPFWGTFARLFSPNATKLAGLTAGTVGRAVDRAIHEPGAVLKAAGMTSAYSQGRPPAPAPAPGLGAVLQSMNQKK